MKFLNSFIVVKNLARILEFSCPMCLMPIEKINLSKLIFLELFIDFLKLFIERSPQPSKVLILS